MTKNLKIKQMESEGEDWELIKDFDVIINTLVNIL